MARAATASRTLGVDVGGTKLLAVVVDRHGDVVGERRVPTPASGAGIVEVVAGLATEAEAGAVGLAVAGLVDRAGVLRIGPHLPGIEAYAFRAELGRRLGPDVAVAVENDATAAMWAEHEVGAAAGCDDAVLVTLGTGIGAGHVSGGVLQRGASGFAGEPGHMILDPDGPPCPCGRRGCWERMASGSGLARLARDAAAAGRAPGVLARAGGDAEAVRGEDVTTAAAAGDPGALEVLDGFAWWVALGVANLVAVLDPEVVVIGGGLVAAGPLLLDPVRRHCEGLVMAAAHRPPVRIDAAATGERAGAVGAALLAGGQRG